MACDLIIGETTKKLIDKLYTLGNRPWLDQFKKDLYGWIMYEEFPAGHFTFNYSQVIDAMLQEKNTLTKGVRFREILNFFNDMLPIIESNHRSRYIQEFREKWIPK